VPLSISDPERLRRQEAVDEIKRALDMVEQIPFGYCVQLWPGRAMCGRRAPLGRGLQLPRTPVSVRRHRGVTIALENTPGEMATRQT